MDAYDIVRIKGLTLPFYIGVHEFEKFRPQSVKIDVEMYVDTEVRAAGRYASYADVCDFLIALSRGDQHIVLAEHLAEATLAKALENPDVAWARVTVLKCDIYPQAEGVGVTIEGARE